MDVLNAADILEIPLDDLQIGREGDEKETGDHERTRININKKIKSEQKQQDLDQNQD